MSVTYRVARSIREFDEACWDALAGVQIAMTHRWQRVMEAALRNYHPLYLQLEDGAGPLAIAVASSMGFLGGTSRQETLLRQLALIVSPAYSSLHCGLIIRPGTSLAEAIPHLEQALGEVCRQEKRFLYGISNVPTRDLPVWQEHRFHALSRPPLAYMDLPWDSYEAYLATLSHAGRRRLQRMRRQAEERGASFEDTLGLALWEGKLYPLLCEVYERHGMQTKDVPFGEEVFAALEREMPGEAQLWVGRVQGDLAGFAVGLAQGQELWGAMIGLRYELARPCSIYFLLLDEVIRWCIGHGFLRLYTGLTSDRVKEQIGFQLQPRWLCFRASSRRLNGALTWALPFIRFLSQSKAHSPT